MALSKREKRAFNRAVRKINKLPKTRWKKPLIHSPKAGGEYEKLNDLVNQHAAEMRARLTQKMLDGTTGWQDPQSAMRLMGDLIAKSRRIENAFWLSPNRDRIDDVEVRDLLDLSALAAILINLKTLRTIAKTKPGS